MVIRANTPNFKPALEPSTSHEKYMENKKQNPNTKCENLKKIVCIGMSGYNYWVVKVIRFIRVSKVIRVIGVIRVVRAIRVIRVFRVIV